MKRTKADWYVVSVRERSESSVAERLQSKLDSELFRVVVPKRQVWFKSGAIAEWRFRPSFPGHVFVMTELGAEKVREVLRPFLAEDKQARWFLHYGDDANAIALNELDRERLFAIYNEDFVAEALEVVQVGDRVEILRGARPVSAGRILNVNRGKRRVLVEFEFFGRRVTEMLGLDVVERVT